MTLDTVITLSLALLTVAVGYLAIHLTLHPLPTEPKALRRAQLHYKLAFAALSVIGVALIGWQATRAPKAVPPSVWRRPATDDETRRFVSLLKSRKERARLRVGCTANSDEACVLASQLIFLFQSAGWRVETVPAQKFVPPRALLGVTVFAHGSGVNDPANSLSGLWVNQTPAMRAIGDALAVLDINAQVVADATMPEDTLGIYCGPDPGTDTPYYIKGDD